MRKRGMIINPVDDVLERLFKSGDLSFEGTALEEKREKLFAWAVENSMGLMDCLNGLTAEFEFSVSYKANTNEAAALGYALRKYSEIRKMYGTLNYFTSEKLGTMAGKMIGLNEVVLLKSDNFEISSTDERNLYVRDVIGSAIRVPIDGFFESYSFELIHPGIAFALLDCYEDTALKEIATHGTVYKVVRVKIGKMFSDLIQHATKEGNAKLAQVWKSWLDYFSQLKEKMERKRVKALFTTEVGDVWSMSTGKQWSSCMNLTKGYVYHDSVYVDLFLGSAVCYFFVDNKKKPVARTLLRPGMTDKGDPIIIWSGAKKRYGDFVGNEATLRDMIEKATGLPVGLINVKDGHAYVRGIYDDLGDGPDAYEEMSPDELPNAKDYDYLDAAWSFTTVKKPSFLGPRRSKLVDGQRKEALKALGTKEEKEKDKLRFEIDFSQDADGVSQLLRIISMARYGTDETDFVHSAFYVIVSKAAENNNFELEHQKISYDVWQDTKLFLILLRKSSSKEKSELLFKIKELYEVEDTEAVLDNLRFVLSAVLREEMNETTKLIKDKIAYIGERKAEDMLDTLRALKDDIKLKNLKLREYE